MKPPSTAVVIVAAGSGSRVGAPVNKVLLPLAGVPLLVHSVRTALAVEGVHRIVLVVRPEDREDVGAVVAPHLGTRDLWMVDGGAQRHDSEWRALTALRADIEAGEVEVVAIHDGARPLATPELFRRVIDAAVTTGAAIPVVRLQGLLSRVPGRPPSGPVGVQTPQAFRAPALLQAYAHADADGFTGTDTASCLERYADLPIAGVASTSANLKVTYAEDLALAAALARGLRPTQS